MSSDSQSRTTTVSNHNTDPASTYGLIDHTVDQDGTRARLARDAALADRIADIMREMDDPTMGGLSPADLIALAEVRIGSVDGDLRAEVNTMNERGKSLSYLRSVLGAIQAFQTSTSDDNAKLALDSTVTITFPSGDTEQMPIKEALRRAGMDTGNIHGEGEHEQIKRSQLGHLVEAITQHRDTISQGAELQQLRIQQLVNQRGQFVQLVSQVLAGMHETNKGILQNTRA